MDISESMPAGYSELARVTGDSDDADRFMVLSEGPARDDLGGRYVLVSLYEWLKVKGEYLRADTLDVPCYRLSDHAVDSTEAAVYLSCLLAASGSQSFAIHADSFELTGHPYPDPHAGEYAEDGWTGWAGSITRIEANSSGFDQLRLEGRHSGTSWIQYDPDGGIYVQTACAEPEGEVREVHPPRDVSETQPPPCV